jgi:hypothetical protein
LHTKQKGKHKIKTKNKMGIIGYRRHNAEERTQKVNDKEQPQEAGLRGSVTRPTAQSRM